MTNAEIDEIVVPSAGLDQARVDGIVRRLVSDLRPVRPVAPAWVRTAGLAALCLAIAAVLAAWRGLAGVERMGLTRIVVIFSVLAVMTVLAAAVCVAEMSPGRWVVDPRWVWGLSTVALVVAFAGLFHDYGMKGFVPQGLRCLEIGMMVAAATGPAIWMVLRRGFAVNGGMAGLAAGTLAGLAGVAMLELHCPNFHAWHVIVWHSAVVLCSGGLGVAGGRIWGARQG